MKSLFSLTECKVKLKTLEEKLGVSLTLVTKPKTRRSSARYDVWCEGVAVSKGFTLNNLYTYIESGLLEIRLEKLQILQEKRQDV